MADTFISHQTVEEYLLSFPRRQTGLPVRRGGGGIQGPGQNVRPDPGKEATGQLKLKMRSDSVKRTAEKI